ncbi:MAG: P-II family nitrogen regulator [Clostridiales bacterium]|nr:P-II family nitrogen regulator [Clostridiales bacterium]
MAKHEVVICIVNSGYSEAVMDSARVAGATGGTVLHARGTANPQAERFFGLTIEPSKDMIMILVDSEIKEKVLHNLYNDVGLKTACQGIAFTLPVNDVVGLTPPAEKTQETATSEYNSEEVTVEEQLLENFEENKQDE